VTRFDAHERVQSAIEQASPLGERAQDKLSGRAHDDVARWVLSRELAPGQCLVILSATQVELMVRQVFQPLEGKPGSNGIWIEGRSSRRSRTILIDLGLRGKTRAEAQKRFTKILVSVKSAKKLELVKRL